MEKIKIKIMEDVGRDTTGHYMDWRQQIDSIIPPTHI